MTNQSADNRSVHTDALQTLGTIHTRQEYRDAIHLAVEPVIAGEDLKAGDHIYLEKGKAYKVRQYIGGALGIVDPFLADGVKKDESFWLVVYPRKITSLRHVWSHPDFPEAVDLPAGSLQAVDVDLEKQAARAWIENYANRLNGGSYYDEDEKGYYTITADELIEYGTDYVKAERRGRYPEYLVKGGVLEGEYTSDEFWNQLEIYLGETIEDAHRGNFFSCSC